MTGIARNPQKKKCSQNGAAKERDTFIKGCEEKHSHTAAHHPVVKPSAVVSTAVSHTPTQQQGCGNY